MTVMMAAACGSNKENQKETGKNADTEVTAEDNKEEDQKPADEEEVAEVSEPEREALTEEDVEALKSSIKNAVVEEYIKPNGFDPASFSWPASTNTVWDYFDMLRLEYDAQNFLGGPTGQEHEFPDCDEKTIIDAAYDGFILWHKSTGVTNYDFFKSANSMVAQVDFFYSIDITTE